MTRYVAMARRPRAWITEDDVVMGDRPSCVVHETDDEPMDTGLLDAHGVALYRVPTRHPIGFSAPKVKRRKRRKR